MIPSNNLCILQILAHAVLGGFIDFSFDSLKRGQTGSGQSLAAFTNVNTTAQIGFFFYETTADRARFTDGVFT